MAEAVGADRAGTGILGLTRTHSFPAAASCTVPLDGDFTLRSTLGAHRLCTEVITATFTAFATFMLRTATDSNLAADLGVASTVAVCVEAVYVGAVFVEAREDAA